MKVVFNGVIEAKTKGCKPCGKKGKTYSFSDTKTYILPSGIRKSFRVGNPVDVSEMDGKFLLSYRYEDANGGVREIFSEVK